MDRGAPINDTRARPVVVCIDFGTYGTSFAYANRNDESKTICVERTWDKSPDGAYFKNPTISLYNINRNRPVAIGFSAQNRYDNLPEEDMKQYILLSNFKLGLYNNQSGEIMESNHKFNVVEVIGDYLTRILDLILARLNREATANQIDTSQIQFVITVPAIWSEQAIATMKQALLRAEIIKDDSDESDCMVVLEPEAAGAFCKEKATHLVKQQFEDGTVFMVVDAGGGTVDITLHMIENKKMKEQTIRNGGTCGSGSIDRAFFQWLESIFEDGKVAELFKTNPAAYNQLRTEWEQTKIKSKDFEQPVNISIPDALKRLIEGGHLRPDFRDIIKRNRYISLSPTVQQGLFKGVMDQVCKLVEEQLDSCSLTVNFILLVGGFGQCPHLLKVMKEKFVPHRVAEIVRPEDCGIAVVAGGVLLGLDPSLIRSRVARQTYFLIVKDGIEVEEVYNESKHEESRLVCRDKQFFCKGVFFPFVACGQAVNADAVVERRFETNKASTLITIYTSPRKRVKYVDEDTVIKLGELIIDTPFSNNININNNNSSSSSSSAVAKAKSFVTVKFQFGQIDFKVEAKNQLGEKCDVKFEFVNSY